MMTIAVMVMLMGAVPNTALAGSWGSVFGNSGGYGGYGYGGYGGYGHIGHDRTAQIIEASTEGIAQVLAVGGDIWKWKVVTDQQKRSQPRNQQRGDCNVQTSAGRLQNATVIYGVRVPRQKTENQSKEKAQELEKRIEKQNERIKNLESQLKNQKSQGSVQQPYLKVVPIDQNSLKYVLVDPNDPQKGVKIVPK